jgi:hypothetical protein
VIAWLKLVVAIVAAEAIEHAAEGIFARIKMWFIEYKSRRSLRIRSRQKYG